MQDTSGLFAISAQNKDILNIVKQHLDMSFINRHMNTIRNTYDLSNSFIVKNDVFIPTSKINNIDFSAFNKSYNETVLNSWSEIINDLDIESKSKIEEITQQKTLGLDINNILIIAGVALVAILLLK